MPLAQLPGESYIRRTRVYIDSDKRNINSKSQFDFNYDLDELYEKIIGIELVGYNIKKDCQQTFSEASGSLNGNNIIDIRMDDVATHTNPLFFTVTIPPRNYSDINELASDLQLLINTEMDLQGHVLHNTGAGVVWSVTGFADPIDSSVNLIFAIDENGNEKTIEGRFMFNTGSNTHNNAAFPLGFYEGADTPVTYVAQIVVFLFPALAVFNVPLIIRGTKLSPYRFLDLRIKEASELDPVARIPIVDTIPESAPDTILNRGAPRLLTSPIRNIQTININLTLVNKRPPTENSIKGFDLIFDFLLLSPGTSIPNWATHDLKY